MNQQSMRSLLETVIGPSKALDRAIARELQVPVRNYSSSVDACLELIHERLPLVHWHVGRGADGISMCATLDKGRHRAEVSHITVPLALLSVLATYIKNGE